MDKISVFSHSLQREQTFQRGPLGYSLPRLGDKVCRDGDDFNFFGNWLRTMAALASLVEESWAAEGKIRVYPVG